MKDIIAILGPTASGKTDIGITLAKRIGGEIISCDSMQVYRYMNIGTAKPTKEELQGINYHLIDIVDPDEEFNAGIYERFARKKIEEIISKNKIPIIVGGTGLYFRALRYGLHDIPKDKKIRKELEKLCEKNGIEGLFRELISCDPEYAKIISPQDKKRIIRALEVIRISGKKFSELSKSWEIRNEFSEKFIVFILYKERETLYKDINKRVDDMIKKGLLREVESLLKMGYDKQLNAMSAIGYKELIEYLEGKYPLEHAVSLIKKNTRRYAKRQFIWFRKEKDAIWIDNRNKDRTIDVLLDHISKYIPSLTK